MSTLGNITKAPPAKCYVVLAVFAGQHYMRSVTDTWVLDPRVARKHDTALEARKAMESTPQATKFTTLKHARALLFPGGRPT